MLATFLLKKNLKSVLILCLHSCNQKPGVSAANAVHLVYSMLLRRVPDLTSVGKFVAEGCVITSGIEDVGRKTHGMDAVFRSEGEYQKRTLIKIYYFQTWKKVSFSLI